MTTAGTLVINSSPSEVRVALLEGGVPVEVYIEHPRDRSVVGNIYRGRVVRVLPGMQAAFVDIGLERTGFLYVNDAVLSPSTAPLVEESPPNDPEAAEQVKRPTRLPPAANIADVLQERQSVLIQVQKEAIGTKGPRITRHLSIPGRHLVFMPFEAHLGVSLRITDPSERERLKNILLPVTPAGGGFIVRTAAEHVDSEKLQREAQMLIQIWTDLEQRAGKSGGPKLILEDLDLVLRATRDLFTEEIEKVIVDTQETYERVRDFVRSFAPAHEARVQFYSGTAPIFDHYGIEVEIQRALDRRVWLKSGGHIVIDQAEALTVIDVNSGKFVGKTNLEATITQINLEAVKEIAYQLRLRNVGGIIIIDFIDMEDPANVQKVHAALEAALLRDKTKTTITRISELGLLEMTRKRVRESLGQLLTESCPYCKNRGTVKNARTVANEILRAAARTLAQNRAPTLLINMHTEIADYLYENQEVDLATLEKQYQTTLIPVARETHHREQFEIIPADMKIKVKKTPPSVG
jgi:ribonuclease G